MVSQSLPFLLSFGSNLADRERESLKSRSHSEFEIGIGIEIEIGIEIGIEIEIEIDLDWTRSNRLCSSKRLSRLDRRKNLKRGKNDAANGIRLKHLLYVIYRVSIVSVWIVR